MSHMLVGYKTVNLIASCDLPLLIEQSKLLACVLHDGEARKFLTHEEVLCLEGLSCMISSLCAHLQDDNPHLAPDSETEEKPCLRD